MSELWTPGGAPNADEFVRALHRQIEAWATDHGTAKVEVELRDGSVLTLESISEDPGLGFVTLTPHGDEPQAVIVPVGSIARVTIAATSDDPPLGFSLPTP
jgi:hypothetical protein